MIVVITCGCGPDEERYVGIFMYDTVKDLYSRWIESLLW